MLLLLSWWIIAGIKAEDPPMSHYRVKNGSLCLQVGKSPPYNQGRWHFNTEAIVFGKNITPKYRKKVHYNPGNHSLCIIKLTETDSGIYKFFSYDSDFKESTETHRLIVQGTVPKPVIRMSGWHSNLTVGLCNITVNCSIQDDWMLSFCDEDSCRKSQTSLFREVNMTIFTDSRSIVCSGNNHVSTNNVSESIEAKCSRKSNPEHEEAPALLQLPTVIVIIFFAACLCLCAFAVFVVKRLSTEHNHHQADSSAAQIIRSQPVEAEPQPLPRVSTSSSCQTEACYENVDPTTPCQTNSPREELGSKPSQQVDSVYSVLQAPNVNSSLHKSGCSKDTEVDKNVQEPSPSNLITLDEAEHPADITTVYSVLQKPKNLKSQQHQ